MPILVFFGVALTLVAGLSAGSCMLPMKFVRRWQWENSWLVFSVVSLFILPWGLALLFVGDLGSVYSAVPFDQLLLTFLLGAGWGVAQILFGLSIARLGMALGYAIIIGLGSLGGTLVPLFFKNHAVLGTSRGALIFSGLGIMVAGIAVSAHAGWQRDDGQKTETGTTKTGTGYAVALLLAILCGIMAPMINYSFAFGQDIAVQAVQQGVTPARAAYAVWPVTLTGGFLPNLAYCVYLLFRKKTWSAFSGSGLHDAGLASLMAVLWMGAMAIYGVASVYLGALGTSVGWGIFQIFMVMTANGGGLVTGEWRTAPRSARRTLYASLAMLSVAMVLLAAGN